MSLLIIAIMAGWFAVSTPVTVVAEGSWPETTDEQWQERLSAVKQSDPWNVGAAIGTDLARIPGDRPYDILAANWKQIPSSARKQILKGFTPGMMGNKGIHTRFFDVMHLGMSDPNPGVRGFAATYIEMQGLPNFEHDAKGYARWRKQNEGRSAQEIVADAKLAAPGTKQRGDLRQENASKADHVDAPEGLEACLEDLRRTVVCYNLSFDQILNDNLSVYDEGRMELFPSSDAWPEMLGFIARDPSRYQSVAGNATDFLVHSESGTVFEKALTKPIRVDKYQTLVFLDGIAKTGAVVIDSYVTVYCRREMAGVINSQSYSTTVIQGDATGRMRNASYGHWVIFGNLRGTYEQESSGTLRVLGGFDGQIKLRQNRAKVFLAGHTPKSALDRIEGSGTIYLEESNLPDGEHTIGKLTVLVGKELPEVSSTTEETSTDFQRGWKMFFRGKYKTSEQLFRRVLQVDSENPHAMNGLGWSLLNQGNRGEAKPFLEGALELEENHWGAMNGLAICLKAEGKIEEAIVLWERMVEGSESPTDACRHLVQVYVQQKQFEKAIPHYEKLVEWHPEEEKFRTGLETARKNSAP